MRWAHEMLSARNVIWVSDFAMTPYGSGRERVTVIKKPTNGPHPQTRF